jgi:predicted flap endonuclease-1-like 5' DNA nuclease
MCFTNLKCLCLPLIGSNIEELLNHAGIYSFELWADSKWDELKALQEKLNAGRKG